LGSLSGIRHGSDTARLASWLPAALARPAYIGLAGALVDSTTGGAALPKRTNTFQEVVAVIHDHMADGATVEHSAMVRPIRGGEPREVDVVVTSTAAGHEVMAGVEACKWSRKADVTWVEKLKAKHDDLPTNKLVLYSGSGFTRGALDKAAEHGIVAIGAEQLSDEEFERRVLEGLRSIWPKLISLTPERGKVWVDPGDGSAVWFKAPYDLNLFFEDGSVIGLNGVAHEVPIGSAGNVILPVRDPLICLFDKGGEPATCLAVQSDGLKRYTATYR